MYTCSLLQVIIILSKLNHILFHRQPLIPRSSLSIKLKAYQMILDILIYIRLLSVDLATRPDTAQAKIQWLNMRWINEWQKFIWLLLLKYAYAYTQFVQGKYCTFSGQNLCVVPGRDIRVHANTIKIFEWRFKSSRNVSTILLIFSTDQYNLVCVHICMLAPRIKSSYIRRITVTYLK